MRSISRNSTITINDFALVQTGTYQEQMKRPFVTDIQHQHVEALERLTNGGRNLGVGAVEQVASSMLHPDAQVEGTAHIAHGWNSRRFRFIMRVIETNPFNPAMRTQRIYFGYTDHCDASINHLPPEMRIYFNSETVIADMVRQTPMGVVTEPRILGSNQIISPIDMNTATNGIWSKPVNFMLRPEDIFNVGQGRHVIEKLKYSDALSADTVIHFDQRAVVGDGGGYKYSRRRDTTPSRYLCDTLKAYKHATAEASLSDDVDYSHDRELLYAEAATQVNNQCVSKNQFFALLKDHAGYMERGYVTFGDLCQIFPEVTRPEVTVYSMDNGRSIRQVTYAGQSEHWRGNDNVTMAASMIAQIVPSIMMDNFIRTISFAATNAHNGDFVVDIHGDNVRSIVEGLNMIDLLNEFIRRVKVDILNPITSYGNMGFWLSISTDLVGESIIDIELDGEPRRRYVAPTFSDSLFTPVITTNHSRQTQIADDILFVLENTIQASTAPKIITDHKPQYTPDHTQGFNNDLYSELL